MYTGNNNENKKQESVRHENLITHKSCVAQTKPIKKTQQKENTVRDKKSITHKGYEGLVSY